MNATIAACYFYVLGVYLVYSYTMEEDVRKDWKGNLALSFFFFIIVPIAIIAEGVHHYKKRKKKKQEANFQAWEEMQRRLNRH